MTRQAQSGFALLIVLWTLAMLSMVGIRVVVAGRSDALLVRNLLDAAAAEAAADAAVHATAFRLAGRTVRIPAGGELSRLSLGGGRTVEVRLDELSGLVNPNAAPPPLMAALIRAVGFDPATAAKAAEAIFDWRTPGRLGVGGDDKFAPYETAGLPYAPAGRRFADLDELADLVWVSEALLAALRPHLSLFNLGRIDPARAGPLVARALTDSQVGQPGDDDIGRIFAVRADAVTAGGGRFTRRAVLLMRPGAGGRPFRILEWESGDG